ncbi:type II secretion system F family protein [Burkholderia gladioli]|uniref:type II secretion system F family protein n=1 Tax=Burkholderia gladioli TaxID=28095 RepID=UPI000649E5EA|nr:type II secretion system F family protein [Burkholderia gladioli]MDA0575964.1 type II secretion system F family protein [Burkholderia gladioli]MDA0602731.1 type II secretion system F family protein [Burkholderia gladioli]
MNLLMLLTLMFAGTIVLLVAVFKLGRVAVTARSRRVAGEIEASLAEMYVFVNRQQSALLSLLAIVLLPLFAYFLFDSVLLAGIALVGALMAPRRVLAMMRKRRIALLERQLPDVLLMTAGALRAGASFAVAMESVVSEAPAPISGELELLMRELRLGIDLDIAMQNIERRIPVPDFLMVTAAVTISREVGGNLAEALESVARTLGAKLQMEGKIRALTSQGRMQGIVMTLLPLGLMVVLNFMEPEAMAPLFHERIGWLTLAVIAVMEFLGYKAISKITNIDV